MLVCKDGRSSKDETKKIWVFKAKHIILAERITNYTRITSFEVLYTVELLWWVIKKNLKFNQNTFCRVRYHSILHRQKHPFLRLSIRKDTWRYRTKPSLGHPSAPLSFFSLSLSSRSRPLTHTAIPNLTLFKVSIRN